MVRFAFFVGGILAAAPAGADWVIFTDGQRTQVQALEIAERAVHITTRAGKRWSVLRDSVDVAATLAANETQAPLEVVTIPEAPPVAAPPEDTTGASTATSAAATTDHRRARAHAVALGGH